MTDIMTRIANISSDGMYRYSLARFWAAAGSHAVFVMLNPSTADADQDDPTIRRCIGFARTWGCGGMEAVNLYAYRATDPAHLWRASDPVGPDNDRWITETARYAARMRGPLIAAWGAHAKPARVAHVLALPGMDRAQALGFTRSGAPRHPLYLPGDAVPVPYREEVA